MLYLYLCWFYIVHGHIGLDTAYKETPTLQSDSAAELSASAQNAAIGLVGSPCSAVTECIQGA